jgi:hypothetical protein
MASPEGWIRAAIEAGAGCPAYPQVVPESAAVPFIVYARAGTDREPFGVAGVSFPVAGTFAVEIYADTYTQVKGLADAVRIALDNFNGTANAATITSVSLTDERDGEPVFFNGQDKPTYIVEHSYLIRWTE